MLNVQVVSLPSTCEWAATKLEQPSIPNSTGLYDSLLLEMIIIEQYQSKIQSKSQSTVQYRVQVLHLPISLRV